MLQINDLSGRIAANRGMIDRAISRVLDSGWVVLGPEVKRFEEAFAAYVGAPHCVSLANGTDAIELALRALGIRAGDRVATVANAGMYTGTALTAIGALPYYVDVDRATHNITLESVLQALKDGVRGVVATHLYGRATPEIEAIAVACSKYGVPLLEDCAQAHGARIGGRQVGTFGDAASFSFYPTKNLGALGDGGAVTAARQDVADTIRSLRQYGWSSKYRVEMPNARNSRLDELQAAILNGFLPLLEDMNRRRSDIARRYAKGIRHAEVTAPAVGDEAYVAHLFVVTSNNRDGLREHLRTHGIASDIHYPIADYKQPVNSAAPEITLPNTDWLGRRILTLPCYPELTDEAVNRVIAAVNGWGP